MTESDAPSPPSMSSNGRARELAINLGFPAVIVVLVMVAILVPSTPVAAVCIAAAGCVAVAQGIHTIRRARRKRTGGVPARF